MRLNTVPCLLVVVACGSKDPGSDALSEFPQADLSRVEHLLAMAQLASPVTVREYAGGLLGEDVLDAGPDAWMEELDCVDYNDGRNADGVGKVQLHFRDCNTNELRQDGRYVATYRDDGSMRLVAEQVEGSEEAFCAEQFLWLHGRVDGWMEVQADGGFEVSLVFDSDVIGDACRVSSERYALSYAGRLDGVFGEAPTRFSGSGTVGLQSMGQAAVETIDRLDDLAACGSEPMSGSLNLSAGGQVAVVTYDGAEQCDEDGSVPWTLDGVDQGEQAGLGCSSVPAGPWWLGLAGALAAIAVARGRCAQR